ncbi:MAG: choice-of-anchor D domain-containing protein, partial [Myxococcales bacterium]|nr:choice-of-anchor D domain-containing protein [Myxococcales bacterium]
MIGWSTQAANAAIAVDMAAIDFGDVTMNTASTPITLTVTNDDTMNTVAVTFTQSAGCNGRLSFTPANGMVPVRNAPNDGQLTVQVRFTPNSRTPLASCTITVDQPTGPDPSVTVAGDSDAPRLVVAAGDLIFSTLRWNANGAGAAATRLLTIDNTGDASMAIANVTTGFTGTHAGDFAFLAGSEAGFPIPPGGTGTIAFQFNPSAAGARTATLNIELNNDPTGESVADVPASGTGIQSIQTFDRGSPYNLGSAPLGGTVDGSVTLRNRAADQASTTLNVSSMTLTGDFVFRDHGCLGLQACTPPSPAAIAVDATETFPIRCTPSAAGLRIGTLTVISDDATSGMASTTKTLTLNCTGVPPALAVAPTSVTFAGNTRVGTPATVQTITISNAAGAQALTYSAATSSMTEFPLSCMGGGVACLSGTVPASGSAQIQVGFVPGAVGARSGMVTLTTNDPDPTDATKVIPLSGTGAISILSANASLAFGTIDIAASGGVTQNLTLTNSGGMPLNISSMVISGDPGTNFTFAFTGCTTGQSCGPLSAINAAPGPGNTLTITLRCDPTTIGAKTGTLNIVSDDPASPRTVNLTCTGATPDIQIAGPPLADFGSQRINTTSATTRTFTISNPAGTTTSNLTYNVTEGSPHFSIACSAPGCSGTLAPGATAVTVTVSFRPTATGPLTGTINLMSNDVSTPSVDVTVTGTGVEPLVALTAPVPPTPPTVGGSLTFPDTNVGATSATQTITIQNTGSMT